MADLVPAIEFFEGIPEELSDVSLRRNRSTGVRTVLLTFKTLKSIERFRSYTTRFANALRLTDEEGRINIEPSSVQFFRFGGPEGDDLQRVECKFEIDREDHWERFMRFMHRYAEANGMVYGETGNPQEENS
ncbi:photosystem II reaction center protein Psb28 [Thermocoleostomius sinensis]|uniref:Photosystem II reaction center Psb28 protein n=1 Tax=Thermocoleostomius sinensis A174 TaxID=2016057 RepID=A0A9E9C8K8_9CYAN|nr:photosystem II reaction center protein Psb28 [Thermocoleostomius sinensis]WAL58547.1 photosystem II reaction center protein Psb28 [Thermocoleostomius sinensis A174]